MPVVRFERSALPAQPCKNGGGVTREIVCMPPGTGLGQFDWLRNSHYHDEIVDVVLEP